MEKQLTQREYLALHPNCSFEEFNQKTGGSKQSWYSARYMLRKRLTNIKKKPRGRSHKVIQKIVQEELVFMPVETPQEPVAIEIPQEPEVVTPEFKEKESHVSFGITPDYVHYEFNVIRNDLNSAIANSMDRLESVVRVMEERDREKVTALQDLIVLNRELRRQNRELLQILDNATTPKGK